MPDRLDELVEAARLFSAGFDFLRVDLYLLPDRIVLGELTPTPYAGFGGLSIEHQAYLGELWNLNTDRESSSV